MIYRPHSLLALGICLALAACGDGPPPEVEAPQAETAKQEATEPESDEPQGFDITTIPVSDAPLGDFPYFPLPDGYHTSEKFSSTLEAGVFPFWVGELFIGVEGRIHQANIRADEGKTFSTREVEQSIHDTVTAAGGVELANMVIPRSRSQDVLTRSFTQEFSNGLCWPSEPVRTYVVHRTDKDIWVHACTYGGIGAAWVVAETATAAPDVKLIGVDALRGQLQSEGSASLPIGFVSAEAALLPGSRRQVEEIADLLEQEPEFRLDVNVHVDDSGSEQHRLDLSEARARAVVAALVDAGVDAGRLSPHGLGDSEPVDDGESAESRARNRRVELVLRLPESAAAD